MGLHKKIETPEEFLKLFNEFKAEKLLEKITVPHATARGVVDIKISPPLTWAAFDGWLFDKGIIQDVEDYRLNTDGRYNDFKGVVRRIDNIMFANKFEGAAVGLYKENIIARDLGLADKKEVGLKAEQPLFGD